MKKEVKEEIKVEPDPFSVTVKQEHIEDAEVTKINSPSLAAVKSEAESPRPSTPKVKLVIRSDGNNFTSSIHESQDSDTDEGGNDRTLTYANDDSNLDDRIDVETPGSRSPLLGGIKSEPIEVDDTADQTNQWSDISSEEKPFTQYLESENITDQSSQNSYPGGGYAGMERSLSFDSSQREGKSRKSLGLEESDQAVHGLLSDDDLPNYDKCVSFQCGPFGQ